MATELCEGSSQMRRHRWRVDTQQRCDLFVFPVEPVDQHHGFRVRSGSRCAAREEQERRLRGRGDPGDKVLARLRKAESEEPVGREQADYVVVDQKCGVGAGVKLGGQFQQVAKRALVNPKRREKWLLYLRR